MKEQLNHKSLRYQWHQADVTVLEGVFARGDRKIAKAILYAYEHGAIFDAWTDFFDLDRWKEAFAACDISVPFYAYRKRDLDELLPWDFIDAGVTKEFLKREWNTAMQEAVTPNCKARCSGCGCRTYGGGICYEV